MAKHISPLIYEELMAEAEYNRIKAELARKVLDYHIEHGTPYHDKEYRSMYQRYQRYKKRRVKLLKIAKGWVKNESR